MSQTRKLKSALAAAVLLTLSATAATAAAGLVARVSVDKAWLEKSDDVTATVVIRNRGTETAWVPRQHVPTAVLDANLFSVTRNGEPVTYLGRLAKRAAPGAGDYVELKPGASIQGRTELSRHYDMADGGEYLVSFRMDLMNRVPVAESGGDELTSAAVAVWRNAPVLGKVVDWDALAAEASGRESLAYTNCSSSQQSGVSSAFSGATTYSTGAKNYLNSKTYSTVGVRYTTWFGAKNSSRFNTVKSHFTSIENAFLTKAVVVDCACTDNYYAYVYPTQPYKIYVCNAFWSAPNTGTDSRAGTLVHEMSHFNAVAATDDHRYGQAACKSLATTTPKKAIDNADSHEYFAENTPAQN